MNKQNKREHPRRIDISSGRALMATVVVMAVIVLSAAVWHTLAATRTQAATNATHSTSLTSAQHGSHWSITGQPASLDTTSGSIGGVGHILVTPDQGTTWRSITLPDTANPTSHGYFRTTNVGWATVSNFSSTGSTITVFRTTDGGHTWQSTQLPRLDIPNATVGDLTFTDDRHGWLVVNLAQGHLSNPGAFFETVDGGATWTRISIPYAGNVYFLDAANGFLVAGQAPTIRNVFFVTHDGGHSWRQVIFPDEPQYPFIGQPVMFTTNDGAVPVASNGILRIYVTQDGGNTWAPSASFTYSLTGDAGEPVSASFSNVGYIVTNGHLYQTDDTGQSWIEVHNSANLSAVQTLHFVSSTVGWAYSMYGTCTGPKGSQTCTSTSMIQRTTDGGAHWTTSHSSSQTLSAP